MKKVLIAIAIILVVVVVGFFVGAKMILANALEKAIGAPVSVSSFKVTPTVVGVYGMTIGNPPGFAEKALAYIPEITISYDLASFLKNKAHIREIRLNVEQVTVERKSGSVNLLQLGAVKNTLQRSGRPQPQAQPQTKPQAPKTKAEKKSEKPMKVTIDLVTLSLGRARYVDSTSGAPVVREFPLAIKGRQMRNITDPKQITMQIVQQVLARVGLNALAPDLNQLGAGLGVQVEQVKKTFEEFMNKMKANKPADNAANPITSIVKNIPVSEPSTNASEPASSTQETQAPVSQQQTQQ